MEGTVREFLANDNVLEIFGRVEFCTSEYNWYKLVKYKKDNKLYAYCLIGDKKLEIFNQTDLAVQEFLDFVEREYILKTLLG